MDYSKLPLAKRTRHQEELFFQRYNEEKKRGKAVAGGGLGMGKWEKSPEISRRKRRPREKSPDIVFLGMSGGDEEQERDDGFGFERREEESPEVVVLVGEEEESEGPNNVAERRRSRSRRGENEKEELGSFSSPFTLPDEDEELESLESSSAGEDDEGLNSIAEEDEGLNDIAGEDEGLNRIAGEDEGLNTFTLTDEDEELESSSAGEDEDEDEDEGLNSIAGEDEGLNSIAKRLRSRSRRGEKKELGSFSSPYVLTDEDSDGEDEDEEVESSSDGEDEDEVVVSSSSGEKSRGKVGGLQGKRRCGHGNSAKAVGKSQEKAKGEKKELGSCSSPFMLTDEDEELESSSDGEDEDEELESSSSGEKSKGKVGRPQGKRRSGYGNSQEKAKAEELKSQEKAKGKVGRPAKRMRPTLVEIEKILADSILEKSNVLAEELVSLKVADMEPTLPLKFRFLDEDPFTSEKSPLDAEVDKLFAEMDFALAACAIGASDSSMVDNEDCFTEETESDPAASCHQGNHEFVIDEQIGYKCKLCSFVKLEIKHIFSSFAKHPLGRPDKNYRNNSEHFNFDKFQCQQSASTPNFKDHNFAGGTVCDLISALNPSMYEHQQKGFEFIWQNIGGSIKLEELKNTACNGGSGCIISHAPGTGKTRLAIVFLQTFMEFDPECRPVIVAPKGMLLTWEEEFKKWFDVPFHNLNRPEVTGRESEAALNELSRAGTNIKLIRLAKLYSWTMGKSVLGISYRLFERLAEDGMVKRNAGAEKVRKMLLELPGLLVLDEGHTPRNNESLMWRALSGVKTQRRILLSGTPFQNNFDELFNTLSLVRPKFLNKIVTGTKGDSRRSSGREGTKSRGKWASLTNSIGKDAGNKLNELRAIIEPFVHVHKGDILEEKLPGLWDAIVVLNPTDLQKSLVEVIQGQSVFKREQLASFISVHPSLLLGEKGLSVDTNELETLRFDPKAGVKTNFLMELIRLSMAAKEKVLVFSQYIEPLTFIKEQLKLCFGWSEGKDLLYMDGKIEASKRQSTISLLNDSDSQVHVLLASIRACCEGIHLVGASRVVLLDVVWNPSVESQAISRAYRIGQKKVVYVYRLIVSGAMEVEKRARQAEKDRLSELVFSSADVKLKGKETISCAVEDDKILHEMVQHEKISHIFEKAIYLRKRPSSLAHISLF